MSELEIGFTNPKLEKIKSNAYWSRVNIDTKLWPSTVGCDDYARHIQDCIDNPTRGLIARRKYITGKPMNYPEYASRNKLIFENKPKVKILLKKFNDEMKNLYKKTRYARKYIIDDDRLSLDTVTRARKYTKFDRTMIFLKKLFHKF